MVFCVAGVVVIAFWWWCFGLRGVGCEVGHVHEGFIRFVDSYACCDCDVL